MGAATRLLEAGGRPSVEDVAAAADVSRRTVYQYFPSLDQLLLDAAVGALSTAIVDAAIEPAGTQGDAITRTAALVEAVVRSAPATLPLGRKIIALTVDPTHSVTPVTPRRGYRRVEWIETALAPLRDQVSPESYERLVSGLSVIIGWEAMVILRDVRGLDTTDEEDTLRWAATTLVRAALNP